MCQYGPWLINILSQILSFSEKLRALKSFFIYTNIKIFLCGQKNGLFLGREPNSIFIGQKKCRFPGHEPDSLPDGQKKARIYGRYLDDVLDGQKKCRFPGLITIVRPDARLAGNAADMYAGQPLKASCSSYAEGLAPHALCP